MLAAAVAVLLPLTICTDTGANQHVVFTPSEAEASSGQLVVPGGLCVECDPVKSSPPIDALLIKTDDVAANPLAGLPRLPTPHHSYGMCSKWSGFPTSECGFPADSNNPLQVDFARITQAWAVDIGDVYLDHNATTGVSIWNQTKVDESQNKSEIVEVVRLCHKANASITITYSPWGDWWNTYLPRRWNNRRAIDTCPDRVGEQQELRYYRYRLSNIKQWIEETNAALGSSVKIGAVLLDAETYRSTQAPQCCIACALVHLPSCAQTYSAFGTETCHVFS